MSTRDLREGGGSEALTHCSGGGYSHVIIAEGVNYQYSQHT